MKTNLRITPALSATVCVVLACGAHAHQPDATASGPSAMPTLQMAAKANDRKLAHRIASQLARTRGLDSAQILVKAHGGVVTLSGSVTDAGQIPVAADAAKQVDGVVRIENRIRVSGASL
jgi:hyperosmotically inducible periplasmic protein